MGGSLGIIAGMTLDCHFPKVKILILGALVGGIIRSLQVFGILASSHFSSVFGKVLSLELSPAVVGGILSWWALILSRRSGANT